MPSLNAIPLVHKDNIAIREQTPGQHREKHGYQLYSTIERLTDVKSTSVKPTMHSSR
jgi:hypothetical protein